MSSLGQILVATDLSQRAARVVERAAALAREHKARLHLLHVAADFSPQTLGTPYLPAAITSEHEARWDAATRAELHALAAAVAARQGIAIDEYAVFGDPVAEIDALARRLPADLIVIGAHGEGFVRGLLLGSTAFKLLQHAACPVLVVRVDGVQPYRNALIGIDFSPPGRAVFEAARTIAPQAQFTAVHAVRIAFEPRLAALTNGPQEIERWRGQVLDAAQRDLDALVDPLAPVGSVAIVRYGHAAQVICADAADNGADLVAVGRAARHGVLGQLGSVSRRVLDSVDCDVLVVPAP
ncbi:MAG: universal stress protein [Rubrivivax sp.]|nr:universal stress protein [Rubrivivax sp.]